MDLSLDYQNIIKLRFNSPQELGDTFFNSFFKGLINIEDFDVDLFSQLTLKEILHYLKKSHNEYLTFWFPKIENLTQRLQNELGLNDVTLTLHSFVVNYYNELSNHINFEEKVLYSFVQKLIDGTYVETEKVFVLNHFLETHSHDVSDQLVTIQKVLLNKKPDLLDNSTAQLLFNQINLIQHDLDLHGIIEDEIFIDKIHQYIDSNF